MHPGDANNGARLHERLTHESPDDALLRMIADRARIHENDVRAVGLNRPAHNPRL